MSPLKRLRSAWSRHGPAGFASLVLKNLRHYGGRLGRRAAPAAPDSGFDRAHGIETTDVREVGSLDIDSANARWAVRYQPSPHEFATGLIAALPVEHARYSFVDYGSGKGRVLLIAAQWPFAAVVGVEFARELHEVAQRNLNHADGARRALSVQCLHADATAFEPPPTPLVAYFYNPFGEPVMRAVAARLEASLAAAPRDAWIVYVHPDHRAVFDAARWATLESGEFHAVLRWRGGAAEERP
jgi:SAM-dependent methyltransferase